MRCLHCGGPYEASTADAVLCRDCASRTFSVGYDEDGAVLHVFMEDERIPRYDDNKWLQANALRPDGKKAKKVFS